MIIGPGVCMQLFENFCGEILINLFPFQNQMV